MTFTRSLHVWSIAGWSESTSCANAFHPFMLRQQAAIGSVVSTTFPAFWHIEKTSPTYEAAVSASSAVWTPCTILKSLRERKAFYAHNMMAVGFDMHQYFMPTLSIVPESSKREEFCIHIEFLTWPIIRYKREVLFGWVDLLVSFGGIAGLFLGFSLLSGVEIIYYFTLRASCMIYRNRVSCWALATTERHNFYLHDTNCVALFCRMNCTRSKKKTSYCQRRNMISACGQSWRNLTKGKVFRCQTFKLCDLLNPPGIPLPSMCELFTRPKIRSKRDSKDKWERHWLWTTSSSADYTSLMAKVLIGKGFVLEKFSGSFAAQQANN